MNSRIFILVVLSIIFVTVIKGNTMNSILGSIKRNESDCQIGSEYKGNYVWCIAIHLAWNELNENIIHDKLKLNTSDKSITDLVEKMNRAPFSRHDLDESSYYIRSGYGQQTIELINRESKIKFPDKSYGDLMVLLNPNDIVVYAFFLKKVEYLTCFEKHAVRFLKETVTGFHTSSYEQKLNIILLQYWNDDKFIIRLVLKEQEDEIFLAKGFDNNPFEEIVEFINKYNKNDKVGPIGEEDYFAMPNLHLDHRNAYEKLTGKTLTNKDFEQYYMAQVVESIKFDMDYKGARVESEAVMIAGAGIRADKEYRKYIMDKPFWVVLKRKNSVNPYFILHVRNADIMESVQ
jgi:hypothetical protein